MNDPPASEPGAPRRRRIHWPPGVPDAVFAPLSAAGLMLIVGALGTVAQQPWLFPSLGPTAFLQAEYPAHRTARLYHVIAGHGVGLAAGLIAVWLVGASSSSSVLVVHHLTAARTWAAVIAVALTIAGSLLLRASHPPAVSTSMLLALGSFRPTWHDALTIAVGVLVVALTGELLRRARLGNAPGATPRDPPNPNSRDALV
ncbi:MAG TPA: HPP family protein [Dehalococcoidia bacterium]|nr:HPP family protein [Dehalococcoidia bacterium]